MELGSGSVRIHKRETQEQVLRLLGISDEDAKFGTDCFRRSDRGQR